MALWEATAPSFSREAYVLEPSGIRLPARRLFYLGGLGGCLQIVYDFHLYVPHNFWSAPFLVGSFWGKLLSAITKTDILRWLTRPRFKGKSSWSSSVSMEKTMKAVTRIPLAHHVTELVDHFPYGLVTLAP